jgi:hypothetical protein
MEHRVLNREAFLAGTIEAPDLESIAEIGEEFDEEVEE